MVIDCSDAVQSLHDIFKMILRFVCVTFYTGNHLQLIPCDIELLQRFKIQFRLDFSHTSWYQSNVCLSFDEIDRHLSEHSIKNSMRYPMTNRWIILLRCLSYRYGEIFKHYYFDIYWKSFQNVRHAYRIWIRVFGHTHATRREKDR